MGKSSMDEGISTAVSGYRRVTVFLATLQRHLEFEQSIYSISPFMGVCVCVIPGYIGKLHFSSRDT